MQNLFIFWNRKIQLSEEKKAFGKITKYGVAAKMYNVLHMVYTANYINFISEHPVVGFFFFHCIITQHSAVQTLNFFLLLIRSMSVASSSLVSGQNLLICKNVRDRFPGALMGDDIEYDEYKTLSLLDVLMNLCYVKEE